MQQPCKYSKFQDVKKITKNPEDLRTKVNLLLYGHLYVVALLICAFVLMGKKNLYINKSMQECYLTKASFVSLNTL